MATSCFHFVPTIPPFPLQLLIQHSEHCEVANNLIGQQLEARGFLIALQWLSQPRFHLSAPTRSPPNSSFHNLVLANNGAPILDLILSLQPS
jgi:hypothetical protein